jgi:hypothetical protein
MASGSCDGPRKCLAASLGRMLVGKLGPITAADLGTFTSSALWFVDAFLTALLDVAHVLSNT